MASFPSIPVVNISGSRTPEYIVYGHGDYTREATRVPAHVKMLFYAIEG